MKKLLIILFFILGIASQVWAACDVTHKSECYTGTTTKTVISCNNTTGNLAVQWTVDSASTNDTVIVPAGSCTWDTAVTLPANRITLQGAGKDSTVITIDADSGIVAGTAGSRITGFGFVIDPGHPAAVGILLYGPTSLTTIPRVDNNKFDYRNTTADPTGSAIFFTNNNHNFPTYKVAALIDNNDFYDCSTEVAGPAGVGNTYDWFAIMAEATNLGGNDTIYIEDNTYYKSARRFGNIVDTNYGGSYVFRYNTVAFTGTTPGYVMEFHSFQSESRGGKKFEMYRNTVSVENGTGVIYLRGGTGVVFDNAITADVSSRLAINNVRSSQSSGVTCGQCDGDSPCDGNEDGFGYKCRDQIGSGPDASAWTESAPYPAQAKEPVYLWGNTPVNVLAASNGSTNHIHNNRDYYEAPNASCSAGGTCTTGVGIGTSFPTSCTVGTGFFRTDLGSWNTKAGAPGGQGVLYKCTLTDTWTSYYTPYTYPHPLRGPQGTTLGVGGTLSIGAGGTITFGP